MSNPVNCVAFGSKAESKGVVCDQVSEDPVGVMRYRKQTTLRAFDASRVSAVLTPCPRYLVLAG